MDFLERYSCVHYSRIRLFVSQFLNNKQRQILSSILGLFHHGKNDVSVSNFLPTFDTFIVGKTHSWKNP
jgi:hypothetical protein